MLKMDIDKNFENMISNLDLELFSKIAAQLDPYDKKYLLLIQNALRNLKESYVYLEIGSHLGGSIQTHFLDPKCHKIYSIDKRPEVQPDERWTEGYKYPNNSTQRMLNNLKPFSKNLHKITCFDDDAPNMDEGIISPKPDICFIDGEHTNKAVISDFNFCKSVLNDNGVIIFHDSGIVFTGLKTIINSLEQEGEIFRAYPLPSSLFIIEFGNCPIHKNNKIRYLEIKRKVKNSYPRLWLFLKYIHRFLNPNKYFNKKKQTYRALSKNSIFFAESDMFMCSLFPKKKLDKTIQMFKPKSVLDLGCGAGKSLDYFYFKGIDVMGIEGSKLVISKAKYPQLIMQYNLNNELKLNKKFDLIWSFEFVEHIHPEYLNNLLKTFSNHSDKIIISAARPGQGGAGHFNEQAPEYWIKQFGKFGYKLNKERTDELRKIDEEFSENMLVFYRQ